MGSSGNALTSEDRYVAAIRDGDQDALRVVVDTYSAFVMSIAWRVLRSASQAEEAAQETFLALWLHPHRFDPARGNLKGFLARIARNKAIDQVRRDVRRREDLGAEEAGNLMVARDSVEREVTDRFDLKDELTKLSDVQREAVVLVYLVGRTTKEISEEIGIPQATVKTRLRDGLTRLRTLREEADGTQENLAFGTPGIASGLRSGGASARRI